MKRLFLPAFLLLAAAACAQHEDDHDDGPSRLPMPKISLKAEVSKRPDRKNSDWNIAVSGEAAYPNGALLFVGLHLDDDPGGSLGYSAKAWVKDGRFSSMLPVADDQIIKGHYRVRVSWEPSLQEDRLIAMLPRDVNPDGQFVEFPLELGTPEEIARDQRDAEQYVIRVYAKGRAAADATAAEFAKQLKNRDVSSWKSFVDNTTDSTIKLDQELSEWKGRRTNFPMRETVTRLSDALTILPQFLLPAQTEQLNFDGEILKPSSQAASLQQNLDNALEDVGKALKNVAVDPKWTPPTAPKPDYEGDVTGHVNIPIEMDKAPHSAPQPGPPPDRPAKARELLPLMAIGVAGLCGIGIVLFLLRRK